MANKIIEGRCGTMKKLLLRITVAVCTVFLIPSILVLAAVAYGYGDANGDGAVNLKDVTILRRMLSEGEVDLSTVNGNPDANGDGYANLKDVTLLRRYLAGGWDVTLPDYGTPEETEPEPTEDGLSEDLEGYAMLSTSRNAEGITCTSFRYGRSVQERDLVCWSIHPEEFTRTVLLNFEIHGWEDEYAADGQILVDLGNALVSHYAQRENLHGCRLLIIPSANPDGLAEGTTNNGFGRCNADGVDLNRDFDASHVVYTNARNYTAYPFSAPESQALRDLVWACGPDVVIDFHGWLNYTIGSEELAEVFSTCVGVNHKYELTTGAHGYFSYWAQLQGAEAILVEFKNSASVDHDDVIAAVDRLMTNNYGVNQFDFELDSHLGGFHSVICYADTTGRIYTQSSPGNTGTDYGYIDGANDECTIQQFYANGWCKVRYPVGDLFKTGYCELSGFIDPATTVEPYTAHTSVNTKVYTTSAMNTHLGSVWSTDIFTVVAEMDGLAQIIYPLDDGGYKMGWITLSAIN